jgi:hypothetical protein
VLGFPIRTPPDHSLVANSPGLIAGSNVLHRLLMPRHPPCALHSLSQQRQNNTQPTHPPIKEAGRIHVPTHTPGESRTCAATKMLASTMQISNNNPTKQPPPADGRPKEEPKTPTRTHTCAPQLILQDPTVCLTPPPHPPPPRQTPRQQTSTTRAETSTIPLVNTTMRPHTNGEGRGVCSLERR